MKLRTKFKVLLCTAAIITIAVGCVTKKPVPQGPTNPTGSTNITQYVPDTRVPNVISTIQGYVATAGQFVPAPYQPAVTATNAILGGISAALLAVSGLLANSRNKHAAAADSMAQSLVAQGQPAVTAALQTAGANGVISTVATHIDNNQLAASSATVGKVGI